MAVTNVFTGVFSLNFYPLIYPLEVEIYPLNYPLDDFIRLHQIAQKSL